MPDYVQLRLRPEERLNLLEENVQDYAIFVVDPNGLIASWNRGAERITGYTEDEAIGMNCAQLFTPEDRARGAVDEERGLARSMGRAIDERWHQRKDQTRFWGSGIMTGLRDAEGNLCGYAKILRDETARKAAEQTRAEAEEKRLEPERRNAVLQERNRIAQEIHDTLAQSLTAIHLQLEAAKDIVADAADPLWPLLVRVQEIAQRGLAETRRSVRALRPQILESYTLVEAFGRMADEVRAGASLDVHCVVRGEPMPLPPTLEDQMLRIGQEAVTNVLRHAEASALDITLHFSAQTLSLEIQDNGRGFDPSGPQEGFGLLGLRERAESLGAQLALITRPGEGTRVTLTVPLEASDNAEHRRIETPL
jgi:PAS domain S-box-containing protein